MAAIQSLSPARLAKLGCVEACARYRPTYIEQLPATLNEIVKNHKSKFINTDFIF